MAEFSVAAVISNHCVLQRNKIINIFGNGENNNSVTVELFDSNSKLLCSNSSFVKNEKWTVKLPAQSAKDNCSIKVQFKDKSILFCDIAIGEVWLAGGQSNMEFELQNSSEGPDEIQNEKNPNVRFYYTNKIAWKDESFYEAEKNTCWQTWDSPYKGAWSAVGYFYGKKLATELGVTVGIIGCNWGGTSASAWMSQEELSVDSELKTYLDEQEEATKGKSIQQQCEEYDSYCIANDEWQKKCNELYATVPGIEWDEIQNRIGPSLWPGPKSCKNPYRPSGLYDCMLLRIIPYTIKGVIWYQGESDDHKPQMYAKLFSRMIQNWRDNWDDNNLPFVFVQLPNHRYKQDPDFKHWCYIREAQSKVAETIKNAYSVCALDLGQYNDIHPKAKAELGKRLANNSLFNVYGATSKKTAIGPSFDSYIAKDSKMIIYLSDAEDGIIEKDDSETFEYYKSMEKNQNTPVKNDFSVFEIAGSDGIYYPAKYTFSKEADKTIIILSNENVKNPEFARYAWFNYGPVKIFGKNNLPLSPFRTSSKDSQTSTEHAAIQQIMTV